MVRGPIPVFPRAFCGLANLGLGLARLGHRGPGFPELLLKKNTRAVLCFCFSKLSDKPTFVHTLLVIRTNRFIPNVDADGKNLLTKQVLNIRIYPRLYDLVMFCEFMVVFELTISLRMSPLVILVTTLELGSRRKKKS